MLDPTLDRDPVEFLAAEFVERLRDGEHPTVEEYAEKHPTCADQIRDLFPTIAAMEQLKLDKEVSSGGRASLGAAKIERLGDLRIIREIGRGGMGIVYEAEQESLARRVAVKVLPKTSLLDEKHLRRFRREAKTAAKLHHTNIVPILGVGEQDGFHYYVMQIIRGAGLDEIIPQLNHFGSSTGDAVQQKSPLSRVANASSVARALVNGKLRSNAHANANNTSSDEISSSNSATSGTDGNGDAITKILTANGDSVFVDDSFVVDEATEPDEDSSDQAVSESLNKSTTRFGSPYWQSVAKIGIQVANALNYAHRQGTLHRDIKPANLLIDEGGIIWVADFGLAKAMEQDNVSRTGDIVGTLRYMAPEQFLGTADSRSDIYSLGLTLYELLTLRPAFDDAQRKRSFIHETGTLEPARPSRVNPSIPRDLETIVSKAIASEPEDRYQTAAELSEDLQRFVDDRPILARRASLAERLRRWARRNPAVASLSGLAVSLLLLVAVISTGAYIRTSIAHGDALDAQISEHNQRLKAEATSELAWDALDKIFERLAPHRYVSPEDFVVDSEDTEEFTVASQPVLSDESAALLDEMLVFYRKLAEQGDDTDEFRQRIALANRRVGDIRLRLGQLDQAEQAYRQAIAVHGELERDGNADAKQAAALASVYNELGGVLRKTHRHDDARDAFETAQSILEPVTTSASPPEVRYELARSVYLSVRRLDFRSSGPQLGSSGGKRGGSRGGNRGGPPQDGRGGPPPGRFGADNQRGGWGNRDAEKIGRAVTLLEELIEEHEIPDYKHLLALCYAEQSRFFRYAGREHAEQSLAQSVGLLEELVAKYPQNPDYRLTLSQVYMASCMPVLFSRGGDWSNEELTQVKDRASTALQLLEGLHHDHPGVPDYLMSKLLVHKALANVLRKLDLYDDALQQLTIAAELEQESDQKGVEAKAGSPTNFSIASTLLARYQHASAEDKETHRDWLIQAKTLIEETLSSLLPTIEADPHRRRFLGYPYGKLAEINMELGDEAAAAKAAENAKKYAPNEHKDGMRGRGEGGPRFGKREGNDGRHRPMKDQRIEKPAAADLP